jgi:hypothetical protein
VVAAAGTPVHAICAGTVRHADGATVRIEGEDGHTCSYSAVQDARVAQGDRVDGGAILGVVAADTAGRNALRLKVVGQDQAPVHPLELLLGAADPNELGYGPTGTGVDVDPEAVAGPGKVRSAPPVRTRTSVPAGQRPVAPTGKPVGPTRPAPPGPPVTTRPAASVAADARTAADVAAAEAPQPVEEHSAEDTPATAVADHAAERPAAEPAAPREREPVQEPVTPVVDEQPPVVEERPAARRALRLPDEQPEEPAAAPPAEQSAEERRKRAAMLIASRKRRPNDSGPAR